MLCEEQLNALITAGDLFAEDTYPEDAGPDANNPDAQAIYLPPFSSPNAA